jgi:hypothetical protein
MSLVSKLSRQADPRNIELPTFLRILLWVLCLGVLIVGCRVPTPSPTQLDLPNIEPFTLVLSSESIYPGETVTIEVFLDGQSIAEDPRYECRPNTIDPDLTSESLNRCSATYTDKLETAPRIVTILVEIDYDGTPIEGYLKKLLLVKATLPGRTALVLDTSARMALAYDSGTRMNEALVQVRNRLPSIGNSPVGLRVFGGESELLDDCNNTRSLVMVAPGNHDVIKEALLTSIGPPLRSACLVEGMRGGIEDLFAQGYDPNIWYSLLTFTGGADECTGLSAEQVVQKLKNEVPSIEGLLEEKRFKFEIIPIGVGISKNDDKQLAEYVDELRAMGIPAFYIHATTTSQLANAIDYVLRLRSQNPIDVVVGYQGISDLLRAQDDFHGIELIEERLFDLGYFESLEWGFNTRSLLISKVAWEASEEQWATTVVDLGTLIDQDETNSRLYFLRGVALWNIEDFEFAMTDLEKASNLDTSWALPGFAKGLIVSRTDTRAASAIFDSSFRQDPDLLETSFFLGFPPEARDPIFYQDFAYGDISNIEGLFFSNTALFTDLFPQR